MMQKLLTTAFTAVVAFGPTIATSANPPTPNPPTGTVGHWQQIAYNKYVQIVDIRVNQINPNYLAKCGVDSPGQRCTIARTDTLTQEIHGDLGVDDGGLAATIGYSTSQSVAISTGCISPEMYPSQEYIAFPTETRYYYQVFEDQGAYVTDYGEYISDNDWTASPVASTAVYDKGVRCRVQKQPS